MPCESKVLGGEILKMLQVVESDVALPEEGRSSQIHIFQGHMLEQGHCIPHEH